MAWHFEQRFSPLTPSPDRPEPAPRAGQEPRGRAPAGHHHGPASGGASRSARRGCHGRSWPCAWPAPVAAGRGPTPAGRGGGGGSGTPPLVDWGEWPGQTGGLGAGLSGRDSGTPLYEKCPVPLPREFGYSPRGGAGQRVPDVPGQLSRSSVAPERPGLGLRVRERDEGASLASPVERLADGVLASS